MLAKDGLEGAKRILELRPDVALVDIGLPRIDGISIVAGDPLALADLRGQTASVVAGPNRVPVPVIPEDC